MPIWADFRVFCPEKRSCTVGNPIEALYLLDIVLAADPQLERAHQVKREALKTLLAQTGGQNLWERMWIAAEPRTLDT